MFKTISLCILEVNQIRTKLIKRKFVSPVLSTLSSKKMFVQNMPKQDFSKVSSVVSDWNRVRCLNQDRLLSRPRFKSASRHLCHMRSLLVIAIEKYRFCTTLNKREYKKSLMQSCDQSDYALSFGNLWDWSSAFRYEFYAVYKRYNKNDVCKSTIIILWSVLACYFT